MEYLDQLDELLSTEHRLMTIESYDQERVEDLFSELSRHNNKAYYLARPGQGMFRIGAEHIEIPRTLTPQEILKHIQNTRHYGIYILCDFQDNLESEHVVMQLKQIATADAAKLIIFLSDFIDIPEALKPYTVRSKHQMRHNTIWYQQLNAAHFFFKQQASQRGIVLQ